MTRKRETAPVPARKTAEPARRPAVALRVAGTGREVLLPADVGSFGIGRDPANHLVLTDDAFVSSFHCLLVRGEADRVVVRDQRSKNGTFVNGTRIAESDVKPGARITIGRTTLALVGAGAPPAPVADLLIGEAPELKKAIDMAQRAAPTGLCVLILGESGSGKELIARLVHEASPRAAKPFVAVNCGAIPREIIESELFGHEKGAFTGANERRLGVFAQAHGGTLFLDEIGELPLAQQPKLLRVLETGGLRPVGADLERPVDVRVVAATHRDLQQAVRRGEFRADLYHRLVGVEVRVPPLRERLSDLPLLVAHFLTEAAMEHGEVVLGDETLAALAKHDWPGNVRELRNVLRRAALLSDGEVKEEHLFPNGPPQSAAALDHPAEPRNMRDLISRALERHGSVRRAAQAVGLAKSTFHDQARKLGLEVQLVRRRRGGNGMSDP
jgi:DNA-binding NtrC family response regulator